MKKEISVTLMQDLPSEQLLNVVKEANRFNSYILIHAEHLEINAKNPLSVMELGRIESKDIVISADGSDSERALESMMSLLGVH